MAGNTRKTGKEQYYTLPEVVDTCVSIAMKYSKDANLFMEPAGGTGEFIKGMLRAGITESQIVSCDIEPKHPLVTKQDFLSSNYQDTFFVLSNPPFGRANSLSVKFFNKAAPISSHICFLIPISWRKWSVINRLDDNFHLVEDVEMPAVSFYNDDGPIEGGLLRTVFQVWEKRPEKRKKIAIEDRGYIRKCGPNDADIAITLFGHSCGRVETEFLRESNTTKGYFKISEDSVVEALKSVNFSVFSENTAYVKALSLPEINSLLNDYFDASGEKRPSLLDFCA